MVPKFSDSIFLSGIIEISPPWMRTSIFPAVSSLRHGWREKVVRKLFAEKPVSGIHLTGGTWIREISLAKTGAMFRVSGSGRIATQAKEMTLDSVRLL